MYLCGVFVCAHAYHSLHEGSEDNLQELLFSFYHVSPRDWTQVNRLACKHLYLWSHLEVPVHFKTDKTSMPSFEETDCMHLVGLSQGLNYIL